MTDLPQTQALPDTAEPAPPKPTLASLIVREMQAIRKEQEIAGSNVIVYWGQLSTGVARLQMQVNALTAAVCVLVLTNISIIALFAWLTGHVR